jgi:hypothetical protein
MKILHMLLQHRVRLYAIERLGKGPGGISEGCTIRSTRGRGLEQPWEHLSQDVKEVD